MRMTDEAIYPHTGETRCNSTAIRQAARHMTRFYDAAMACVELSIRLCCIFLDRMPCLSARWRKRW